METESSIDRVVELRTPKTILFGVGAHRTLPQKIKTLSKGPVLVVTDPGLIEVGIIEKIKKLVLTTGLKVKIFDDVEPDPDIESVERCLDAIKSIGAQVVVGIGGGSSLDVAKASSALVINGGQITDYVGIDKLPMKGLPTILLPTTSGTGSEVTPIAVFSDKKQHLKLGIVSQHLYCDVAIVDPELTISCPAHITASSGMDSLTHAIEVYINKFSVPIIDTIALETIRLVGQHLRRSVEYGSDLVARQGMSLASLYGGLGLGPVNTAAVHALAYPLGGMFNVPHGLANSILLPYVLEFNLPACELKFARIAEALGVNRMEELKEKASAAVEMIVNLSKDIGIPRQLRDIKIPKDAIGEMALSAMKVKRLLNNNPRQVTLKDAREIYQRAY